jgi:single stranded DNA-binding protein
MNRVEIAGGLVRDPEFKMLGQSQTPCLEFTVAVNGTRYDSQQRQQVVKTTYVAVQAFNEVADDVMGKYPGLTKGDAVYVVGELDQRTIEKADGTKESKTRVNAMHIVVQRTRTTSTSTGGRPAAPRGGYGAPPPEDPWATPPRPPSDEPPF